MGIKGLWGALKPYVHDGHLCQFRGRRIAVDMYVWLHRSVVGCVEVDLERLRECMDAHLRGETAMCCPEGVVEISERFIESIVGKVEALQRFGVVPVCVFDGAEVPMKQGTETERRERREHHLKEALRLFVGVCQADPRLLRRDSPGFAEGLQSLEKATDISTELAHAVIEVLRDEKRIECIVAPYEADAQLAYLCREGYVHAVLTEDSDLIAYNCPCIIAKSDLFTGRCEVLLPPECNPRFFAGATAVSLPTHRKGVSGAPSARGLGATAVSAAPSTADATRAVTYTYESFLLACIMSGCDYVPNMRLIGVKKAFALVAHTDSLSQLMQVLEQSYGFPADEVREYQQRVLKAFYCFAHHIVYCPSQKRLVTLHPLPSHGRVPPAAASLTALKTELVGELWPDAMAQQVCRECTVDPCTLERYGGRYRACAQRYIQRTRRGQTVLSGFSSFRHLQPPRVVVRPTASAGHVRAPVPERTAKRPRPEEAGSQCSFSSPLLRKVAVGFVGTPKAASGTGRQTIIRSKYFLRGCVVMEEHWSSEEEEEGEVGCASSTDLPGAPSTELVKGGCDAGASAQSQLALVSPVLCSSAETGSDGTLDSVAGDGVGLSAAHECAKAGSASTDSLGTTCSLGVRGSADRQCSPPGDGVRRAAAALAADADEPTTRCECPFGYWQCNRRHSIFDQCFQGRGWIRGERGGLPGGGGEGCTAVRGRMAPASRWTPPALCFRAPRRTGGCAAEGVVARVEDPEPCPCREEDRRGGTADA